MTAVDQARATLARLGVAETELGAVSATLARRSVDPGDPDLLPTVALARDGADEADLRVHGELGRGGMGIVEVAEQRSLRRDVAVKTVKDPGALTRRALVREARAMGGLEHPNVVPVHALGADERGEAVLVMKRVEGVSWRTLLDDPANPAWEPLLAGHGDRMRANVEVLMQLARALAFAHSRGVIHRDLKPDNVMIGRFGEVYLLDWGLALRLDERAHEPHGIVGTPGYFAPEMARGIPSEVDARTDVYLLGATLAELLTGAMPHAAPSPIAALAHALLGEVPALPESAPYDLAALVRSALALDPSARPQSAEAFRTELARHLVSHEADGLVASADRAMERAGAEPIDSAAAHRALIEARFALEAALDMRAGDVATLQRHDACVRRLVERELALRSPAAARTALADLRGSDPALEARIAVLENALREEQREVDAARRATAAADISSAWPVIAGISVIGAVVSIPLALAWPPHAAAPQETVLANVGIVAFLGVCLWLGRRRLLGTSGSRRLTGFMIGFALYSGPPAAFAWAEGASRYPQAEMLAVGAVIAAIGAVTVLPGVWPSAPMHLVAAVICFLWPDHESHVLSIFIVLNTAVIVRALRARAIDLAAGRAVP